MGVRVIVDEFPNGMDDCPFALVTNFCLHNCEECDKLVALDHIFDDYYDSKSSRDAMDRYWDEN